jgi:hypothetical protein
MKKNLPFIITYLLIFTILISLFVSAQPGDNLYRYDSLDIQTQIKGGFDLIPETPVAKIKQASAQLLLYPQENNYQSIQSIDLGKGQLQTSTNNILYTWNDGLIESKKFGYTSIVQTKYARLQVKEKISFPLSANDIKNYESYTLPTQTIDSNNPKIIKQASQLTQGEDDLFKVVFKIAYWVESNVQYDLNTLTASASQKASWVLDNKKGVCDEMTSLFVAMLRSLGIPARFVSGISYTTSDLFNENWQPHGWAEVYFPNIGWVSFDTTFGQYGYVDVTHIKLRDGFDPAEPATKYEWIADKVKLDAKPLSFDISLLKKGKEIPEEIQLAAEVTGKDIGFGSYNQVKGILKNTANYYTATTLQLAVPEEIKILGRNKRTILLAPKEVKETLWTLEVPSTLPSQYTYTFPLVIYTERNTTSQESFTVHNGKTIYTQSEIETLNQQDEEKSYSRKVSIDCDYPSQAAINEKVPIKCTIKNTGEKTLNKLQFCIEQVCEEITLFPATEKTSSLTQTSEKAGWQKILVSLTNSDVDKKSSFEYAIYDPPSLKITPQYPSQVKYGENIPLIILLDKTSFTTPKNIVITVKSGRFEQTWELSSLQKQEQLTLLLENLPLTPENKFTINLKWQDEQKKSYTSSQTIVITSQANNLGDRIKMYLNELMLLFS